jgi:hypothetical protein
MQSTAYSSGRRLVRIGAIAASAVLIAIGIGSIVKGMDGRSQVHDALAQEQIKGMPEFTPSAIAAKARAAGLQNVTLPTCSVAGEKIDTGGEAKCFAESMRVDALTSTKGATYAQMPRFASKDDKGTNDVAQALTMPNGAPMNNPARQVWVTETALSTALNASYMAEQTALFGTVVGGALLLVGFALGGFGLSGLRVRKPALAKTVKRREAVLSGA